MQTTMHTLFRTLLLLSHFAAYPALGMKVAPASKGNYHSILEDFVGRKLEGDAVLELTLTYGYDSYTKMYAEIRPILHEAVGTVRPTTPLTVHHGRFETFKAWKIHVKGENHVFSFTNKRGVYHFLRSRLGVLKLDGPYKISAKVSDALNKSKNVYSSPGFEFQKRSVESEDWDAAERGRFRVFLQQALEATESYVRIE